MASTLNISLPESLMTYVDAQTGSGDYATPSEYVSDLILADRERRLQALEERLLESLKGEAITLTADEVERGGIVALLRQKLAERQGVAA